jgi:hypothetical protein
LYDIFQISRPCRKLLAGIQVDLTTVSSEFPEDEICSLAGDLAVCIATLGAVRSQNLEKKIRVVDGGPDVMSEQPSDLRGCEVLTSYQTALQQINDPLIPVRGHALIMLTRLVHSKDAETLQNVTTLVQVFKDSLCHGNSYVYLAAINGLVALALSSSAATSESVLTILLQEYAQLHGRPNPTARTKCDTVPGHMRAAVLPYEGVSATLLQ